MEQVISSLVCIMLDREDSKGGVESVIVSCLLPGGFIVPIANWHISLFYTSVLFYWKQKVLSLTAICKMAKFNTNHKVPILTSKHYSDVMVINNISHLGKCHDDILNYSKRGEAIWLTTSTTFHNYYLFYSIG